MAKMFLRFSCLAFEHRTKDCARWWTFILVSVFSPVKFIQLHSPILSRSKLIQNYLLHIFCDSFGCKYRSNITGIIYNNEMGDFSTPGQLNPDDIPPSKSNFIKPGKRPQSSISPVIFTDRSGQVRLVAGASGGPLITTAVSLVSNLR